MNEKEREIEREGEEEKGSIESGKTQSELICRI